MPGATAESSQGLMQDLLLFQAEKIYALRQARSMVVDPVFLGEPAWDLLLCAFISRRRSDVFYLEAAVEDIGVSVETGTRWARALQDQDLFIQERGAYALSEGAEAKMVAMLEGQIIR